MKILLHILLFPRDLLYFTVDSLKILVEMVMYRHLRTEHDQPCIYCKNRDCGYNPRRLPPGIKRYRNRWMGCLLQPCTRKITLKNKEIKVMCAQEGGFVKYPRWTLLFPPLLFYVWFFLFKTVYTLFFLKVGV